MYPARLHVCSVKFIGVDKISLIFSGQPLRHFFSFLNLHLGFRWLNGLDRWIGRGLKRWKDEWEGLVIKYLYGLMDGGWMAG